MVEEFTKKRNEAVEAISAMENDPNTYNDFRINLMPRPKFVCPEENFNIPDVNSELQKMLLPESSPSTTLEQSGTKGRGSFYLSIIFIIHPQAPA